MNLRAMALSWQGPPLSLQILGLLLGSLVVAQCVTLALTLLLPPAPQPQYDLADIARLLSGDADPRGGGNGQSGLQRLVQPQPPEPAGPGWLTSEASRRELAGLVGLHEDHVRLAFYTPLPFAGMAVAPPLRVMGQAPAELRAPSNDVVRVHSLARVNVVVAQVGGGRGGPGVGGGGAGAGGVAAPPGAAQRMPMPASNRPPPSALPSPAARAPGQAPGPPPPATAPPALNLMLPPLPPFALPSPLPPLSTLPAQSPPASPFPSQPSSPPQSPPSPFSSLSPFPAPRPAAALPARPEIQQAQPADAALPGRAQTTEAAPAAADRQPAATANAGDRAAGDRAASAFREPAGFGAPTDPSAAAARGDAAARPPRANSALRIQTPVARDSGAQPAATVPPAAFAPFAASAQPTAATASPARPQPQAPAAADSAVGRTQAPPSATATGAAAPVPAGQPSAPPSASPSPRTAAIATGTTGTTGASRPATGPADAVRGLFGLAPAPFVVGDFVAGVRLAGGAWAVVQPTPEPFPNAWQRRVLLWFAVAALLVAPLAWLFSRRLVRPIAGFARAAEQLGRDPAATILPLRGPAEVGRAAQAFNRMHSRLRSFVDDRTAMIGAISHDLRTPLTRMRFRIEEAPVDLRAGMLHDVEEMETMIHSVLAFIRDASEPGSRELLDLRSLVEDVVEDAVFVGKDVVLQHSEGARVEVDAVGMRRVLVNLVENAVKYGERAEVRLFTDRQDAVAEISDQGRGLPDDELERVFQPFYRTPDALASAKSGAGLGLAVCRSIARAHGGDVNLKRGARGLVAQVRVPLAHAASG